MPRVKHAVFMKFKPTTPPAVIREIYAGLESLRHKIPGLLDFSGGPDVCPERLNKGFAHGFVMTFTDAAARDVYLPHPAHEAVKKKVLPELDGGLDGVIVVDWEER